MSSIIGFVGSTILSFIGEGPQSIGVMGVVGIVS